MTRCVTASAASTHWTPVAPALWVATAEVSLDIGASRQVTIAGPELPDHISGHAFLIHGRHRGVPCLQMPPATWWSLHDCPSAPETCNRSPAGHSPSRVPSASQRGRGQAPQVPCTFPSAPRLCGRLLQAHALAGQKPESRPHSSVSAARGTMPARSQRGPLSSIPVGTTVSGHSARGQWSCQNYL